MRGLVLRFEKALNANGRRVNTFDILTPGAYMREMEKLHAAATTFFVPA